MRYISGIIIIFLLYSCRSTQNNDQIENKFESHLNEATSQFRNDNKAFLINIVKNDTVLFQVVHSSMIEATRQKFDEFGFSINLTFDLTFKTDSAYLEKFKRMKIFKDFMHFELDGIEIYVFCFKNDVFKGSKLLAELTSKLYNVKLEDFKIELHDHGLINLE
jgi:hypothetical protein